MSVDNNGSGSGSAGKDSGSALEKYLQKQEAGGQTEVASGSQASYSAAAPNLNLSSTPATSIVPAGFWRRLGALIVDGVIISLVTTPLNYLIPAAIKPNPEAMKTEGLVAYLVAVVVLSLLSMVFTMVVQFFYYGWFYSKKGATPGKMLLGLKVLNSKTGTHLTYAQAFIREALAKAFLSGVFTFGIGYLIAAFRDDKKALHDLVCTTQVVRVKK